MYLPNTIKKPKKVTIPVPQNLFVKEQDIFIMDNNMIENKEVSNV